MWLLWNIKKSHFLYIYVSELYSFVSVCVCYERYMLKIYIYIYTHTHTHTHICVNVLLPEVFVFRVAGFDFSVNFLDVIFGCSKYNSNFSSSAVRLFISGLFQILQRIVFSVSLRVQEFVWHFVTRVFLFGLGFEVSVLK